MIRVRGSNNASAAAKAGYDPVATGHMWAYARPVKEESITSFGLVIAYLLPGLIALWGLGYIEPTVRTWLGTADQNAPTIGGFLYGTLASIGCGLLISTVRWLVVDTLHRSTGLRAPKWSFSQLQKNIEAFDRMVELHYRYYQFFGNSAIALLTAD